MYKMLVYQEIYFFSALSSIQYCGDNFVIRNLGEIKTKFKILQVQGLRWVEVMREKIEVENFVTHSL